MKNEEEKTKPAIEKPDDECPIGYYWNGDRCVLDIGDQEDTKSED